MKYLNEIMSKGCSSFCAFYVIYRHHFFFVYFDVGVGVGVDDVGAGVDVDAVANKHHHPVYHNACSLYNIHTP